MELHLDRTATPGRRLLQHPRPDAVATACLDFHRLLPRHDRTAVMSSLSEPRRPRLLPQNRKLRHLKGLSLRNLSFQPPHTRSADDAALNRSPGKLEVLRETRQLHPSRSSESLRKDARRPADALRPTRPRKMSLSLVHANAMTRQKRLEEMLESAVGDVFFSLHVGRDAEPVYISETRERSAV